MLPRFIATDGVVRTYGFTLKDALKDFQMLNGDFS